MQKVAYRAIVFFGRVELRAWIEFDGDKLIGMGSKKTYDETGNLIACDEAPTGLIARMASFTASRPLPPDIEGAPRA